MLAILVKLFDGYRPLVSLFLGIVGVLDIFQEVCIVLTQPILQVVIIVEEVLGAGLWLRTTRVVDVSCKRGEDVLTGPSLASLFNIIE